MSNDDEIKHLYDLSSISSVHFVCNDVFLSGFSEYDSNFFAQSTNHKINFDAPSLTSNDFELLHQNKSNYYELSKENPNMIMKSNLHNYCNNHIVTKNNEQAVINYLQTRNDLLTAENYSLRQKLNSLHTNHCENVKNANLNEEDDPTNRQYLKNFYEKNELEKCLQEKNEEINNLNRKIEVLFGNVKENIVQQNFAKHFNEVLAKKDQELCLLKTKCSEYATLFKNIEKKYLHLQDELLRTKKEKDELLNLKKKCTCLNAQNPKINHSAQKSPLLKSFNYNENGLQSSETKSKAQHQFLFDQRSYSLCKQVESNTMGKEIKNVKSREQLQPISESSHRGEITDYMKTISSDISSKSKKGQDLLESTTMTPSSLSTKFQTEEKQKAIEKVGGLIIKKQNKNGGLMLASKMFPGANSYHEPKKIPHKIEYGQDRIFTERASSPQCVKSIAKSESTTNLSAVQKHFFKKNH